MKKLIVQQKLTLPWDLYYVIQKPANTVISTLMKITHSLINICCFVLTTIQKKINKQDTIEVCTQEKQNRKWRFKLITNVSVFAALIKNVLWDVQNR